MWPTMLQERLVGLASTFTERASKLIGIFARKNSSLYTAKGKESKVLSL